MIKSITLFSLSVFTVSAVAQFVVEETIIAGEDTVTFAAQIPSSYSAESPPAIVVAWHSWGSDQYEIFSNTDFDLEAESRGWILASHIGQNYIHWNNYQAQFHCEVMLGWLSENFPFDRDSIYMIGGSMGGAAGQVWHVNNCGSNDFLIAATAGGSQILDTELRAIQYLDSGDTNRSMRDLFGDVPGLDDSVDFEYHRASAIYLADTTQSMHFNSLTLPVWNSWGSSELEWLAYGNPALDYEALYRADSPELNEFFPSGINNHGLLIMWPEGVFNWLSQFSVNRYPDEISISADENDDYYYTTAELAGMEYEFGRYGMRKNSSEKQLDITLLRNIRRLTVNFDFPWSEFDTLRGVWENGQRLTIVPIIALQTPVAVDTIYRIDNLPVELVRTDSTVEIPLFESGEYVVVFEPTVAFPRSSPTPVEYRLVSAYPNPFNSEVTLEISSNYRQTGTLLVYDVLGRLQQTYTIQLLPGVTKASLSGENLSSGSYFINLEGSSSPPIRTILLK